MVRFHVFSGLGLPGVHVWRESAGGTNLEIDLPPKGPSVDGWWSFEAELDSSNTSPMKFMLFEWADGGARPGKFENDVFIRTLPRVSGGGFPTDIWCFQDSATTCLSDPRTVSAPKVRIHLVTSTKYRDGFIYIWRHGEQGELIAATPGTNGVVWDLPLAGERQRYFNFKFRNKDGTLWEPEAANRTWAARAGAEVWVKSESAEIVVAEPVKKRVRIHFSQGAGLGAPEMWLWQDNSGFEKAVAGSAEPGGGFLFEEEIYTGMRYGARFFTNEASGKVWEHPDVRRTLEILGETELWALEGESAVLVSAPKLEREITIHVPERSPDRRLDGTLFAHVWVDRARAPLHTRIPVKANGAVTFKTYEGVTTSVKFHNDANWEAVDRHVVYASEAARGKPLWAVLDRFQLLREAPPVPMYQNPPFEIRRPGVYEEDGHLHVVLHAPRAARVRLWGAWMAAGAKLVDLLSTVDRTFWWAQLKVADVQAELGGDYHGAEYHYVIDNDRRSQDPAAGWVVHSGFDVNSRLVRSSKFVWTTDSWRRPTWDYLIVYQVHPRRFSGRGGGELKPLQRVKWEIENNAGYFLELGATAVLLMPVHEFKGDFSWGYDPAFFYVVESSYGGPDALKELVDTCHRHGKAVILDLVLNHSGGDNPLWELGRETFFDGDTTWGALVNFDHPQCKFFFEKCVTYRSGKFVGTSEIALSSGDEWNSKHHHRTR
jgi:hypothetical protein